MNKILEDITKQLKGHYCHVVEVFDVYELQDIIDTLVTEFKKIYSDDEIMEFFTTLTVYASNDEHENDIYKFSIRKYVKELLS